MSNYYRKIVVGQSLSNCVYYVKGSSYTLKGERCEISDIIDSERFKNKADIFVISGDNRILWKTVSLISALEIEFDVNFE